MIKFFRKIRQRLLTENKFSKYLIYAMGEIILVVIGILIALQINNWNENRVNNNLQKQLLATLKIEFSKNQELLTEATTKHQSVVRLLEELNNTIAPEPQEISNKRLDSLMFGLGWVPSYQPNDGVLNSIISSGRISLIKNNEISSMIASWNSNLKDYHISVGFGEKQLFEEILPYINNKYPIKNIIHFFSVEYDEISKFKYSKNTLLSDLGFESLVSNRIIDAKNALQQAETLYNLQNNIVKSIESELKR